MSRRNTHRCLVLFFLVLYLLHSNLQTSIVNSEKRFTNHRTVNFLV